LRDELLSLRSDTRCEDSQRPCLLFEEFLVREAETGQLKLPLGAIDKNALVHGHCHQKSFGAFAPVEKSCGWCRPEGRERSSRAAAAWPAPSAGADTYDVSIEMAEASLLPAVRKAADGALIVADGTSCRHQIKDGSGRGALHVARVLAISLTMARRKPLHIHKRPRKGCI
jgi:Fe-S oxidoreductase